MAEHLYGDAKITAKAADPQAKQKALVRAKEKYEANKTADNHLVYANALFDTGKFQEAELQLRDLVKQHGEEPHVLFDLGFAYRNLKKPEEAQKVWLRLVELHPKHPMARAAENEIWRLDPTYKPSWIK